jgi:hypothetical protein
VLLDIEPAVFEASDHTPVIKVLDMVAQKRHDWHPSLAAAASLDRFVAQLTTADIRLPVLSEWAQKAFEEAAHRHETDDSAVQVTLAELKGIAEDLERAAVLVVENRLGDGAFVRGVARALGHGRIVDALRKRWLIFSHGGGCGQMPKLAAEECQGFTLLVRVAALYDGDRRAEGGPGDNDARAERTRAAGVREVHVLAYREAENYLPFRVWEHHFPRRQERIAEVRAMLPRQRGYDDLKVRIGRIPAALIPDVVELTEDDFAELGSGVVAELRELLAMIHRIL